MAGSKRQSSGQLRDASSAAQAIRSSLAEIRFYPQLIEAGDNLAARTLSAILRRVIADELPAAGHRNLSIKSCIGNLGTNDFAFPLTSLEVTSDGTRIIPVMFYNKEFKMLRLNDWKNEIAVNHTASHSYVHPSSAKLSKSLSREALLNSSRNEMGAHYSPEMSTEFLTLFNAYTPLDVRVSEREGVATQRSAKPPHKWNYYSASIATIAYEILTSEDLAHYATPSPA